MGDIKRKRKKFIRPKKPFDRTRIDEENILVKKYGLKNKREIWKATTKVSDLRRRAKGLIGKEEEKRKSFLEKLNHMGIAVGDLADVLALKEENVFDRRLQTILFKKKLANTPRQARQLIVHKHVVVDGNIVNTPSFHVNKDVEAKISVKPQKPKKAVAPKESAEEKETPTETVTEESEDGKE